jgi:Cof subfamily protein (haloacid dehalogenase superfamily)
MEIKMIVCDLDRTLLRMDGHFSEYTLDIWERCRKMGIVLAFATARPNRAAAPFVERAKPDIAIVDGGGLVKIGDETIFKAIIPKETAWSILQILQTSDGVGFFTASTDNAHLVNEPVNPNDPEWEGYFPVAVDFSVQPQFDIYKISPQIFDPGVITKICKLPDIIYTSYHGGPWGTFNHARATKWQAIQKVAAHLNIDIKHIAAFGDDFGDIEMIEGCGIGVAVANALPEVLAVADFVCDSNDNDGVAKWLEENVIIGGIQ